MKKTLATVGVFTATAFAGLGIATVASAQLTDADEADTTTESGADVDGAEATERGSREGRGHRDGKGCGDKLEGVAEILGIEADDVKAQLDEGATLAEIAETNGTDPNELVDAMVADATERVEAKVAEGRLTEEEAAEKLAEKADKIEDRVFSTDDDAGSDESEEVGS